MILAVSEYSDSNVDLVGYSMGSPLARKVHKYLLWEYLPIYHKLTAISLLPFFRQFSVAIVWTRASIWGLR